MKGHKVAPILYSTYYRLRPRWPCPFTLAVFVTIHLQVGKLIQRYSSLIIDQNHYDHTPFWGMHTSLQAD